jgi:hypothetical protein
MDIGKLKEIVAAFADDPASLIVEKGRIVVQLQEELISAVTTVKEGQLFVTEDDGAQLTAERWVAQRIAQMDFLADRIISLFPASDRFVTPRGILLDQIEEVPDETPQPVDNALSAAKQFLSRKPGGTCSVLYLTSDAGEGKTTLIGRIANDQAKAYRAKHTDWLLVPISLGGSPFLRLDNVIAAALLNQLRIRRFYFDAFMQLVRLGFLVPALDGFEEVFVETEGDAVSSLGNLIQDMRGEGTLLIAARAAYFDVRRLDRQARLLDAMPTGEVGFGRLSLRRWGQEEFIAYCGRDGIGNPRQLYENLASIVGPDHPLLTRAVFVRRIADLAKSKEGFEFLHTLNPELQSTFLPFIDRILEREMQEKWLDKQNEIATPLLSLAEHHELLRLISEEMWISKRGALTKDMCDSLADIFCETENKSPVVSRQVRERLISHALLTVDGQGGGVRFDHDHFKEFFLGEQIGNYLSISGKSDLRKLLRLDAVSPWTLDTAAAFAMRKHPNAEDLLKTVLDVAASEGPSSFVRENAGALSLRLAQYLSIEDRPFMIADVSFPPDSLRERVLKLYAFERCYFRSTKLSQRLESVSFVKCEFEHIDLLETATFQDVRFSDCVLHGLTVESDTETIDYYDPQIIEAYLSAIGVTFLREQQTVLSVVSIPKDDENVRMVRKLLTVFRRCTQVSDSVLFLRMGVYASTFRKDLLPTLLDRGLLVEIKSRGGGNQRRFRLGRSMASLADALAASRGNYEELMRCISATSPGADQ